MAGGADDQRLPVLGANGRELAGGVVETEINHRVSLLDEAQQVIAQINLSDHLHLRAALGAGQQRLSPYDPESGPPAESAPARPSEPGVAAVQQGFGGGGGRGGRGGGGGGFGGGGFAGAGTEPPRVVMRFPANPNDMLLSGTLAGGQALANRAQVVDVPLGQGHVVMFAIRPFWRWQTQGTYFLAFNAILNWNDLDAGRATESRRQTTDSTGR